MANDDLVTMNGDNDLPSGALLPASKTASDNSLWHNHRLMEPAGGADLVALVHGLRRHWLLAIGLGVLCAAAAGVGAWFAIGDEYTASAIFRVAMQEISILPNTEDRGTDRDRFDIYKSTQRSLLLSRFVLTAAIRRSEMRQLAVLKEHEPDPESWLAQQLSVDFPGKAEFMEVAIKRKSPQDARTLVNAVVQAYLSEVVNREKSEKQRRLDELDKAFNAREDDIRARRTDLKELAKKLGTDEREMLTEREKLALDELNMYRQELARLLFDTQHLEAELAGQQAVLKNIDTMEMADADLDLQVQADPAARQLFTELGLRRRPGLQPGARRRRQGR